MVPTSPSAGAAPCAFSHQGQYPVRLNDPLSGKVYGR
jgi:hypothetical protein